MFRDATGYRPRAMVAQAQFSTSDVQVAPGDAETFQLTLVNLGNHTETFTLVPAGLLAGWVWISPPMVTLFGGSSDTITVTLEPPMLATTPAGAAPLTVRIIPQDEPDEVMIAETTAIIGAFHDRRIHLLQPVVRSRRRAIYEFLVENQGNSQASCRLHLIDVSQRLDGDFDPPAVGVEPGGTSLVRLKMKAVRRHWRRGSRTLPFSIEADQQGFPTAAANATFVQTPAIPEGTGRRLLALAVVAAVLGGAWFGLIRPLTERTARDAVADRTATFVIDNGSDDPTATTVAATGGATEATASTVATNSTVAPVAQPVVDPGTAFSRRFRVEPQLGQPGTDSLTVPEATELRITDFILQNAFGDSGVATVAKNGETIQQWDLGQVYPSVDPLQLFSPLVFRAGDVITFTVQCTTVGGGNATCIEGLLMSGLSYAAT
jgi:hypothetical protein